MCQTPVCTCTQNNDHVRTLKIHVCHIRVRWITKTRKDPGHALVALGSAALAVDVALTQVMLTEFPEKEYKVYKKIYI